VRAGFRCGRTRAASRGPGDYTEAVATVDPALVEATEATRAKVRAARDELLRRAAGAEREKVQLAKRLKTAQQSLAEARRVLSGVELESERSARRRRLVDADVLKVVSGLFGVVALAGLVGLIRHGGEWAPWVFLFPVAGALAYLAARVLSQRLGGDDA